MNLWNFPLSPPSASNFTTEYDLIFYTLLAISVFFTVAVVGTIIFFVVKYRAGSSADRSRPVYEDLRLELTWTIIPTLLAIGMFTAGAHLFYRMRTPPKNAEEVYVMGKQWMWHIEHPNGVREMNELHVPVGKPVKLTMISQDVIHAFYIPAFRTDMYVIPGRYTQEWFTATKPGRYHLFCNLFCGTQHSEMGGTVIAMPPREYAAWLDAGGKSEAPMTMAQAGLQIFDKVGCANCHGQQATLRAPSLAGLYKSTVHFANGGRIVADEDYLRTAILKPETYLVKGYINTMPAYSGQLTEDQVLQLIAFIKSMTSGSFTLPSTVKPMSAPGSQHKNVLAVGAIRAISTMPDAAPTTHKGPPAVGALAAERGNRQ